MRAVLYLLAIVALSVGVAWREQRGACAAVGATLALTAFAWPGLTTLG